LKNGKIAAMRLATPVMLLPIAANPMIVSSFLRSSLISCLLSNYSGVKLVVMRAPIGNYT
jgi:hypothetical protein